MARRRNTRRRNPIKSTGMLVINPRRRNTRRKNTRRRNTRRRNASYRKIAGSFRKNTRRRNTRRRNTRRRNTRRRNTRARTNPRRRRYTRRKRRSTRRRRNSVLAYRRRNTRRRNSRRRNTRRRNTRRKNTRRRNTKKGFLAKIPVVGKALEFLMPAGLGALAVEPTLMVAKFLGPMVPRVPASLFYVATGLLLASVVVTPNWLVMKNPMSAKLRKDLALAIASATGGVAYYKWRTGSDVSVAAEAGALEVQGVHGWADGLAYAVQPFSGYGAFIHGR